MQYSDPQRQAIHTVESLRAGIPTRISTRELPDLRGSLTDTIRADLLTFAEGRNPRGRMLWGQYGQGKTHVLTTVEHMALDMGFAVSMLSLSREVSCHNLLQFYGRVAPRIRVPDSTILGIEKALAGKDATDFADSVLVDPERYVHPLPGLVLEDYLSTSGEEQNLLYSDLTGIRLPLAEIKRIHRLARHAALPKFPFPFKATEHASAYFGVMADAIRFAGYKGWVILIDEVELIGRLGNLPRLKAYRNLHWLLNWSGTLQYPIYTLAAAATRLQDDIWYGGGKDDRNLMPQLAADRFDASAKHDMEVFFERAAGAESLVTAPVTSDELCVMLEALADIHAKAYNWPASLNARLLIRELGSQPVRTYVRAALESLDIQHIYKQTAKLETTTLEEQELTEDEGFFAEENPV